ncbi:MAG TPA: hypothetical protein VKA08_11350 [Balneolales bacterium]|nr:hypothetical protein [Balneolales bacterium]
MDEIYFVFRVEWFVTSPLPADPNERISRIRFLCYWLRNSSDGRSGVASRGGISGCVLQTSPGSSDFGLLSYSAICTSTVGLSDYDSGS